MLRARKEEVEREYRLEQMLAKWGDKALKLKAAMMALRWDEAEAAAFLATLDRKGEGLESLGLQSLDTEILQASADSGKGVARAATLRERGENVTIVPYTMREIDKLYVRSVLSLMTFVEFRDTASAMQNPHPVLRAFKEVVDAFIWRGVQRDAVVLEVGPNVVTAVKRGVQLGKYLGLVPRVTSADVERAVGGLRDLRLRLSGRGRPLSVTQTAAAEDALRGKESRLFKQQLLQNTTWRCDVIMALDSAYDIPLEAFVSAMYRCKANEAYITLVNLDELFAGEINEGAEGRVGKTEMCWRAYPSRDRVEFFFRYSSTRPYTHRLSVLREYFRFHAREFTVGATRYLFQRRNISNEVKVAFQIIQLPERHFEQLPGRYKFVGGDSTVKLFTQTVDLRYSKGDYRRHRPVEIEVGRESFTRVFQDRMARGPGKLEEVLMFARTNRVNVIHNGVRVSGSHPVSIDQLTNFCEAVDVLAAQLERTAQLDEEIVLAHINTGGWVSRGKEIHGGGLGQSLWSRLIMSMAEVPGVSLEESSRVTIERMQTVHLEGERSCNAHCETLAEAVRFRALQAPSLSMDERTALGAWIKLLEQKQCCCTRCIESREAEEDQEVFFDANSECSAVDSAVADLESLCPEYIEIPPTLVVTGRPRAAVKEYVEILTGQIIAREDETKRMAKRLIQGGGITVGNIQAMASERMRHYGVQIAPMGQVTGLIGEGPNVTDISRIYDPVKDTFWDVSVTRDGRAWVDPAASSLCYSSDEMSPWINPMIIKTMERVLSNTVFGAEGDTIPFVNGIWGSGKSHLAVQWFEKQKANNPMFVGSSRKPTDEVRELLYGDDEEGRHRVRTVGSLLCHGFNGTVDCMVIDEVCMEHSAVVYALLEIYRPKEAWIAGDMMQMPYIPFLAGCKPKYASIISSTRVALLQKGHRVPEDVYASGLEVYGKDSGIHPCDCPEHQRGSESMQVHVVDSISCIPCDAHAMYLTHGQVTKKNVIKRLQSVGIQCAKGNVATMAEYQGGTADRVIIVRDVRAAKPGTLYHEIGRNNVGMSRSKGKTEYWTVSHEKDRMVKFIEASKREDLRHIITQNRRKYGSSVFGVDELLAFIAGNLNKEHPALIGGLSVLHKYN